MRCYNTCLFEKSPVWDHVPEAPLMCVNWEKPGFSRPLSFAKLCAVKDKGIFARLWSFEENVCQVYTKRDDPIYKDSCVELFIRPFPDSGYLNFEMNRVGAYLSEYGKKREGRFFIKALTEIEPTVTPITVLAPDGVSEGWGCEIFIPDSLISAVTKKEWHSRECTLRGNFYKCADESLTPHYLSYFPAGDLSLGFHNPDCFGEIILKEGRDF